jgi:UDP-N-acetylmuramoylalanine--D-glutamate ligase
MKLAELKGKKILILGLGKEGLVTARYLKKHLPGMRFGLADLKELENFDQETAKFLQDPTFDLQLGSNYLEGLENYEIVIKSPGINARQKPIMEAVEKGVILTSPTRIFFANKLGKVVGITGSKGKSTTTSLIYKVLKEGGIEAELVGNIGRGALEYLDQDAPDKVFVFEMSSYQLEDFDQSPEVAVMVSFFPDHLDYHGSLQSYLEAKLQLISHLKAGAKVVYNAASSEIKAAVERITGKREDIQKIAFNDGSISRVEGDAAWLGSEKLVDSAEIQLIGKHNLQNMLAAAAVGQIFGVPMEKIRKALRDFKGLEHRLELVGEFKGIIFYNDAISTTPESTIAGIDAVSQKHPIGAIIVGGLDRGYQFDGLAEKILEAGIAKLIILPDTGEKIWQAVQKAAVGKTAQMPTPLPVKNMEEAVRKAFETTRPGTICLLSNASPSYNLFKNFEDKGRQFKEWVNKIGQ